MKYYVKLIFRNMSDRSSYGCIHNRPNEDILSWEHCPILSSYFFKSYLANVTLSANKYKKRVCNVISMDGVCTELSGAVFENLSHCAVWYGLYSNRSSFYDFDIKWLHHHTCGIIRQIILYTRDLISQQKTCFPESLPSHPICTCRLVHHFLFNHMVTFSIGIALP